MRQTPAQQAGFGQPKANIGDGNRKHSTFNTQRPTPNAVIARAGIQ
jgi:hypothetical protein